VFLIDIRGLLLSTRLDNEPTRFSIKARGSRLASLSTSNTFICALPRTKSNGLSIDVPLYFVLILFTCTTPHIESKGSRSTSLSTSNTFYTHQLLPPAEQVNSRKNKFFGIVTHLNTDLAEWGHAFHQFLEARLHHRHFPLIIYQRREQVFVGPLGRISQSHVKPPSGRTLSATLEGGLRVFILVVAPQCQSQAIEQLIFIARWRIKVPEKRGVRRNA
jgi:hypothetical protein